MEATNTTAAAAGTGLRDVTTSRPEDRALLGLVLDLLAEGGLADSTDADVGGVRGERRRPSAPDGAPGER